MQPQNPLGKNRARELRIITRQDATDASREKEPHHGGIEVGPAIVELSTFMKSVRPLLSKNDADLESALKSVATPGGGKGLKHILTFIDNKVSFITNKLV